LLALREVRDRGFAVSERAITRGTAALAALQQPEGGWSGGAATGKPCSVEETGAALEALARTAHTASVDRGVLWLVEQVESGAWKKTAPIGFYFARLWYFERLYPQIAAVAGLGRVMAAFRSSPREM
jgi:squalene-hopene/tetraprenyl-beta-curcumene cyclase